jgi:CrcB protein
MPGVKRVENIVWVALGGCLGAVARYWLADWVTQRTGPGFPYGTLLINVTGSFVLGLIQLDPRWRLFFAVGFLGAYTTFSTYTYESVELLLAGRWWAGLANVLASNVLGLVAAALGIALAGRL